MINRQNPIFRTVAPPAIPLQHRLTTPTPMPHQLIHQGPQLPPRNPIDMIAVLRKDAHRPSRIDVFGVRSQTRNVIAVVELSVGIGAADEAFEALHGVAIVAGVGVLAAEGGAPTAA